MELIDRDDLLLNCQEAMFLKDLTLEQRAHIIVEYLDNAPTVDAIPLSVIDEIKAEIRKQGINSGMLLALEIIDEKVKEVCVL